MTCNNVFLTQPQAGGTINYTLPEGDSARLNFSPEDMSGLRLDSNGGLIISFADGGEMTITNFAQLTDSGSLMYLADGTLIDAATLTTALQTPDILQTNDIASLEGNINTILPPGENTTQEIALTEGQKYICDFDPANSASIEIVDGKMVLTFTDGSQVVFNNYTEMMAGELPPELTLADGSVIETDAMLTEVLDIEELAQVEETIGEDIANIEPAAGDETASEMSEDELAALALELAEVMPAAGETSSASSNSGYGFNSTATEVLLDSPDAIGALGATNLQYNAPNVQGDSTSAQRDDIPLIAVASESLDETSLLNGNLVAAGTISVDYGNDFPGTITSNGNAFVAGSIDTGELRSGGNIVTITQTPLGYEGVANGEVVFTFEMNPNSGSYTYTQIAPFDHADANNNNDIITLNLGFNATDLDGDTSSTVIRINVADDAPVVTSQIDSMLDESFSEIQFGDNGTVNGKFYADVGQDIADTPYTANGNFETSGSVANNVLASNGVVVEVISTPTGYIGTAGDETVFTLTLDPATGEYSYNQFLPLDHADGNDANDILQLQFGVDVTDFDGDTDDGFITINIVDDAPELNNSEDQVNEKDLTSVPIVITNTLNLDFNADGSGTITTTGNFEVTGVGAFTHNGVTVEVTSSATGYVGVAGTVSVFSLEIDPTTGEYSFTQFKNLDHDPDGGDEITLTFGAQITDFDGDTDTANIVINIIDSTPEFQTSDALEPDNGLETIDESGDIGRSKTGQLNADFGGDGPGTYEGNPSQMPTGLTHCGEDVTVTFDAQTNTFTGALANGTAVFTLMIEPVTGDYAYTQFLPLDHADTTDANDVLQLQFGVNAVDSDGDAAEGSIIINVLDDGPQAENDTASIREGFVLDGNILNNDDAGADGLDSITEVSFNGDNYSFPASGLLVIIGEYGQLTIQSNGNYVYAPNNNDPDGIDNFGYTIQDCDGDTSSATLSIDVSPDREPINISGRGETDDSNVDGSAKDVETGEISVDYQGDGSGATTGNGKFTVLTGNLEDGTLSRNGVPINVTFNEANNTYTGKAGSLTIFTMKINANGTYRFEQYENLDHGNTESKNEGITIQFGVDATDADGDIGSGTVTIVVRDDGPDAVNDSVTTTEGKTVTGNVTSNDDEGADDQGDAVTQVMFGGNNVDIPTSGSVTVTGSYGTLTISSTGTYSYKTNTNDPDGKDIFTYTLTDGDGDTDTATLSIDVSPDRSPISIFGRGATDDGNTIGSLKDTETGDINVNYQGDGPGRTDGNGNFSVSGNFDTSVLRHEGIPIHVTYNASNDTYTGKAGSKTIFTMKINANETYTFQQFENIDHSNTNSNNEALYLNFGVTATDADGDTGNGVVRITVLDDGPLARDDSANSGGEGRLNRMNLLNNDYAGADGGLHVYKYELYSFGRHIGTYNVTEGGNAGGMLTGYTAVGLGRGYVAINQDGDFYHSISAGGSGGDTFTSSVRVKYFVKDGDGDTSSAWANSSVSATQGSPLVLDLDGDGIELVHFSDGVNFDIDNDGNLEQSGWVSADDGLLALDINNDGVINNQSELFGNNDQFDDGFANLASYDTNQDGVINADDEVYEDLVVWQDTNQDGISDEGEMLTLTEIGIVSISLNADMPEDVYIEGNWISHVGTYTTEDGQTHEIVDAWFTYGEEQNYDSAENQADNFLFDAIGEASSTMHNLNASDDSSIDISQMLETADDITESIQDFVHNANVVESINDVEEIPASFDLGEQNLPDMMGDNGSII